LLIRNRFGHTGHVLALYPQRDRRIVQVPPPRPAPVTDCPQHITVADKIDRRAEHLAALAPRVGDDHTCTCSAGASVVLPLSIPCSGERSSHSMIGLYHIVILPTQKLAFVVATRVACVAAGTTQVVTTSNEFLCSGIPPKGNVEFSQ